MNNASKSLQGEKLSKKAGKLHYIGPVLTIFGTVEAITQGNGKGRKTDSSQFTCNEAHPEVCNS